MEDSIIPLANLSMDLKFSVPSLSYEIAQPDYNFSCQEPSPDYFWPNLYHLFTEQKNSSPYHLAVQDEYDQYSYIDLDARVNQIAQEISYAGIEREDVVGICLSTSAELVATILAVFKIGAAFVLFDDRASLARKYRFMRDSAATVLLSDAESNSRFNCYLEDLNLGRNYQLIAIDQISRQIKPKTVFPAQLENQLAYAFYQYDHASGPATLSYEHGAILEVISALKQKLPIHRLRSMLTTSSVYQSSFVSELFFALTSGITINFINEADVTNPFALNATIKQTGADLLVAPSAVLNNLEHASTSIFSNMLFLCLCDSDDQVIDPVIERQPQGVLHYYSLAEQALCAGLNESQVEDGFSYHPMAGSCRIGMPRGQAATGLSASTASVVTTDGVRLGSDEIEYYLAQHPAVEVARVESNESKISIHITLSDTFGAYLAAELEVNVKNLNNEAAYPEINVDNVAECLSLSIRLNDYLANNLVVSFHPDCYIFTS